MNQSSFGSVNWYEALKGLIYAVAAAVAITIYASINAGDFKFDWTEIAHVALASGVGYIVTKFFTNSDGKIASTEKK